MKRLDLPTHVEEIFTEMGRERVAYLKSRGSLFEEVLTSTPQRMPQPPISDYFSSQLFVMNQSDINEKPIPMNMVDTVKELLEGYLRNGDIKEKAFADFMIRQADMYNTFPRYDSNQSPIGRRVQVMDSGSLIDGWTGTVFSVHKDLFETTLRIKTDNGVPFTMFARKVKFID